MSSECVRPFPFGSVAERLTQVGIEPNRLHGGG